MVGTKKWTCILETKIKMAVGNNSGLLKRKICEVEMESELKLLDAGMPI